ncbi:MAG: hypothetical protein ACXWCV_17410 [Caldimonas sp.]
MRLRALPASRSLLAGAALLWALLLVGCVTPATATATAPSLGPVVALDFIQDGVTTIEECEPRLGPPSKKIPGAAGGQMLTFWLEQEAGEMHVFVDPRSLERARYSLVLSFDARGVLTRHALVKVWGS